MSNNKQGLGMREQLKLWRPRAHSIFW